MIAPSPLGLANSVLHEDAFARKTRYRIAANLADRSAAYWLVYRNYRRKGLIEPNRYQMRVTPYHLLPTTNTISAVQQHGVICTLTLIGDGELGLPMETVYWEEVENARRQGLSIGEVSCLASQEMPTREFLPMFIDTTRVLMQHARAYGLDQLLITTHPKHGRFYERFMGFRQIGPERPHPSVGGAPAAAYCLDFARIDRDPCPCYSRWFDTPIPFRELQSRPMSSAEVEFFAPATECAASPVPVCA